jgi:hypothetical protein
MPERITPQRLTEDEDELANTIRDLTFELLGAHERVAHEGHPCGMNRVSHVAWMAHCLGIGSAHLQKLMACIAMYESGCDCGIPTLLPEHFEGHK